MKLAEAIKLGSLQQAQVVAGAAGVDRTIRWVHIVDLPDPLPWVRPGDFMLTTGYAWPADEAGLRKLVSNMAERGLAGIGLAVPNFLPRMPDAARQAADELHLPLVEIPWEIPFTAITEEIHNALLSRHYDLQRKSETIHQQLMKAVVDAQNPDDIAATLGRLIRRSVTIKHPDGPALARFTLNGDIDESDGPAAVFPISIKGESAGSLWIAEGEHSLTELEIRAAEHATIILALHLSQQRALASLEAQLGNSLLDSLLEGTFEPSPQAFRRAEMLGFHLNGVYSVAMIVMELPVPLSRDGIVKRERLIELLKRHLAEADAPALLSLEQNQIFFLIPESVPAARIWEKIEAPDLALAVSRCYQGFDNVKLSYKELRSIISHLRMGTMQRYEQLLVPRVLMGDSEAQATFLELLLGPLRRAKNGDILVQTILEAARFGFHFKQTAEALHVHPKTLRYRLDRVTLIGGFDLADPEIRFQLQLAARLLSSRIPLSRDI